MWKVYQTIYILTTCSPSCLADTTKLAVLNLELLAVPNQKQPLQKLWIKLQNISGRTPPCSPGRSETDFSPKECVTTTRFQASPPSTGKNIRILFSSKFISNNFSLIASRTEKCVNALHEKHCRDHLIDNTQRLLWYHHIISYHLISSHLISSHIISYHLISSHIMSYHNYLNKVIYSCQLK